MSFLRHREIYPSDGGKTLTGRAPAHRLDEFPTGYSLAGCSPAEPASASPASLILLRLQSFVYDVSANGNLSLILVSHHRGAAQGSVWALLRVGRYTSSCRLHELLNVGYIRVHGAFAMLNSVAPFFIVDDLGATLAFYQSKLGFDVLYKCGGDGNGDDYLAIMGRDRVMLMFKAITPEVHPQPNRSRHEWARWDAYIDTDDPDSLYTEFVGREVPVHRELANTSDGLRAFEITDNSGYVLCFGHPVDK